MMGRFVILSGPSCAGKSPLMRALGKFYPEIGQKMRGLVCYNSRSPRPGEIDGVHYYFRRRDEIEKFREKENFAVREVRGDLQAVDLNELEDNLKQSDVFFEGNPLILETIFDKVPANRFETTSVFLSPLSGQEIRYLKEKNVDMQSFVTDMMRRKLLRRTQKQKGILSQKDLENIERRAGSALREMKTAIGFDYVIPNHDGEDSDNWDAFYYPIGDAKFSLDSFADLLAGRENSRAERWDKDIFDS